MLYSSLSDAYKLKKKEPMTPSPKTAPVPVAPKKKPQWKLPLKKKKKHAIIETFNNYSQADIIKLLFILQIVNTVLIISLIMCK